MALIVNITSEAGSIGACHRVCNFDYAMEKAALNMATMTPDITTFYNWYSEIENIELIKQN